GPSGVYHGIRTSSTRTSTPCLGRAQPRKCRPGERPVGISINGDATRRSASSVSAPAVPPPAACGLPGRGLDPSDSSSDRCGRGCDPCDRGPDPCGPGSDPCGQGLGRCGRDCDPCDRCPDPCGRGLVPPGAAPRS